MSRRFLVDAIDHYHSVAVGIRDYGFSPARGFAYLSMAPAEAEVFAREVLDAVAACRANDEKHAGCTLIFGLPDDEQPKPEPAMRDPNRWPRVVRRWAGKNLPREVRWCACGDALKPNEPTRCWLCVEVNP